MKISRRDFMKISAALSLQACASKPFFKKESASAEPNGVVYYVASPQFYLGAARDFSKVSFDAIINRKGMSEDRFSQISIVRESDRKITRLRVPGTVHTLMPKGDLLYLVTADFPSYLYAIDLRSLEIIEVISTPREGRRFGGHVAEVSGGNVIAATTNESKMAKYGWITLRDKKTLKEVGGFSSYGFEGHDLKSSADGKILYVGHYGSLLGTGPYRDLAKLDLSAIKDGKAWGVDGYKKIFPGSISVIEVSSGKLLDRISAVDGGAHCHFAIDGNGNTYLPHRPSLIKRRGDEMTHLWFQEGDHGSEHLQDFVPKMLAGYGTTIVYDESSRQVLIPSRWSETLNYISQEKPSDFKEMNLLQVLPQMQKTHGLVLHPNGKDYVITGENWIAAFDRKSHKFIPERSFEAPLLLHAHAFVSTN